MIYENILELIGNTPVVKLNLEKEENIADVYIKLEKYNLGGSVKDRAALGMIEAAEKDGKLQKGGTIVEPTSGNTGISLALIGKLKGYKVIIIMPDTASVERRDIIKAFGAELILTDGAKGMKGSIAEAERIVAENPGYFLPQQFENSANPQKHYDTTANEILADFPVLDAFVAGIGTARTLIGVAKKMKEERPNTKIFGVEPVKSPIISGGEPGKHVIQGIGAGFVPKNYDGSVVDEIIQVTDEESLEYGLRASKENGLFLGISSGAAIAAAYKVAKQLGKGKKVLAVAPDGGEKYLSVALYK